MYIMYVQSPKSRGIHFQPQNVIIIDPQLERRGCKKKFSLSDIPKSITSSVNGLFAKTLNKINKFALIPNMRSNKKSSSSKNQ